MRRAAAAAIAILFLYYETYRWVPLGRWNWQFAWPVNNNQFYPDIVIGALLLCFVGWFARGVRAGMTAGAMLLTLWSVVHLFDWWIPYARNNSANQPRYSFYQPHTQLLPVFGHHYPPDAGHAVLDFLLFPACALAITAALQSLRKNRPAIADAPSSGERREPTGAS